LACSGFHSCTAENPARGYEEKYRSARKDLEGTEIRSNGAQQTEGFHSKLADQQKQIEAPTAGLQKASSELAVGKTAPQPVLNEE
jgi:hypothetical protein